MSKPLKKITSKTRKKLGNHLGPLLSGAIALFVVWFCNGIWHGAGWNYIFFGMYHFALILLANITNPLSKKYSIYVILIMNPNHGNLFVFYEPVSSFVLVNCFLEQTVFEQALLCLQR